MNPDIFLPQSEYTQDYNDEDRIRLMECFEAQERQRSRLRKSENRSSAMPTEKALAVLWHAIKAAASPLARKSRSV